MINAEKIKKYEDNHIVTLTKQVDNIIFHLERRYNVAVVLINKNAECFATAYNIVTPAKNFSIEDFEKVAEQVKAIKKRLYYVRKIYKGEYREITSKQIIF